MAEVYYEVEAYRRMGNLEIVEPDVVEHLLHDIDRVGSGVTFAMREQIPGMKDCRVAAVFTVSRFVETRIPSGALYTTPLTQGVFESIKRNTEEGLYSFVIDEDWMHEPQHYTAPLCTGFVHMTELISAFAQEEVLPAACCVVISGNPFKAMENVIRVWPTDRSLTEMLDALTQGASYLPASIPYWLDPGEPELVRQSRVVGGREGGEEVGGGAGVSVVRSNKIQIKVVGLSVTNYYFCLDVSKYASDGFEIHGTTFDKLTETALQLAFGDINVPKCLRMLRVTYKTHGSGFAKLQKWLDTGCDDVCNYIGSRKMCVGKRDEFTLAHVCAIARELRIILDLLDEEQKNFLRDGLMLVLSRMGN